MVESDEFKFPSTSFLINPFACFHGLKKERRKEVGLRVVSRAAAPLGGLAAHFPMQ